jgi:hypothetical protein
MIAHGDASTYHHLKATYVYILLNLSRTNYLEANPFTSYSQIRNPGYII